MLYSFTPDEIRSYCRTNIESLEIWARRLIHQKMIQKYGEKYYEGKDDKNNNIVKKEIREHASYLISRNPNRFPRWVDALFIDDLVYLLCHPALYHELFKKALDYMYPQRRDEVNEFLQRIVPVRNALSHSNPISIRQAEQMVCYCKDFIDSIKLFYKNEGEEQVWNVPTIIRAVDSEGKEYICKNNDSTESFSTNLFFQVGDDYKLSIEIDSSFEKGSYSIRWFESNKERVDIIDKSDYMRRFAVKDVNQSFMIQCRIISSKEWHKFGTCDCYKIWFLSVLPPKD